MKPTTKKPTGYILFTDRANGQDDVQVPYFGYAHTDVIAKLAKKALHLASKGVDAFYSEPDPGDILSTSGLVTSGDRIAARFRLTEAPGEKPVAAVKHPVIFVGAKVETGHSRTPMSFILPAETEDVERMVKQASDAIEGKKVGKVEDFVRAAFESIGIK